MPRLHKAPLLVLWVALVLIGGAWAQEDAGAKQSGQANCSVNATVDYSACLLSQSRLLNRIKEQ